MERGVYAPAHIRIKISLHFNCLRDLVTYVFPNYLNAFMIPFEAVGVFSILILF